MDTEEMIKEKGLIAPRITPEHIASVIDKVLYKRITDTLTVCVIITKNGFNVTGESACASPENFDKEIGEHIAYKDAESKIWVLEGYLLKQYLYEHAGPDCELSEFIFTFNPISHNGGCFKAINAVDRPDAIRIMDEQYTEWDTCFPSREAAHVEYLTEI